MFVEPHFNDTDYAKNIRTNKTWTSQETPLKYGIYNVMYGGRQRQSSKICNSLPLFKKFFDLKLKVSIMK